MTMLEKKKVLLAEDDSSMRRFIEVTLQKAGFDVLTAEDGLTAMQLALKTEIDAIVADAIMPNMTGYDLCRMFRDRQIPCIILSGLAENNPDGKALDCASLPPIEVGLPAHSAPLGMSFLAGTKVPAPWSGGAVLAAHGSWDRQEPRPPAVLWLRWDAKRHTLLPARTLVGGFQEADGERWGCPVDVVPGPEGDLFVSDDTAGAIYKLSPP